MRQEPFYKTEFFFWLRLAVWCVIIFILSAQPDDSPTTIFETFWDVFNFLIRKVAHLAEYFVLMIFAYTAIRKAWPGFAWRFLAAFLFCLGYAISDEWHQTFIPGRIGTVRDVWIDSLGALFGAAYLYYRRRTRFPDDSEPE